MKIGLVLVLTSSSDVSPDYCRLLKSLPIQTQTIIWNSAGYFAGFISSRMSTPESFSKMIVNHSSDHQEIIKRVKDIQWFTNCYAILILNYGKVGIKINPLGLELSPDSSSDLTIVESVIPIKITLDKKSCFESEMLKLISDLRISGKNEKVIRLIDSIRDHISSDKHYLLWYEESICSYYIGDRTRGREACLKLLDCPKLESWRISNIKQNLTFYE